MIKEAETKQNNECKDEQSNFSSETNSFHCATDTLCAREQPRPPQSLACGF